MKFTKSFKKIEIRGLKIKQDETSLPPRKKKAEQKTKKNKY